MIKSTKIQRKGRRKFNKFGLIISYRGDPHNLYRVVWRIPHFSSEKNLIFFRNESSLPLSKNNFLYQGLSFPYPGLFLRGVRDSEAGKFVDNIAFADFLLLGAYS